MSIDVLPRPVEMEAAAASGSPMRNSQGLQTGLVLTASQAATASYRVRGCGEPMARDWRLRSYNVSHR